jgi:chitin disaccharide deacetylase
MRVIVNGDDFGASEAVNLAIIRAFDEGILTSCSLMVSGEACEQAVEFARTRPRLAVGLHLVLVCGRSALPHSEIPNLVDIDRNFSNSPFAAGMRYHFSSQARAELKREINAQMEKFAATGLPFSHVDGHLHLHMHPTVFTILAEAAEHHGVKRIRLPRENLLHTLRLSRARLGTKLLWWTVFQLLCRHAEQKIRGRGFSTAERVYGLLESGSITEDYWLGILPQLSAMTNEIYCHPEIAGLAPGSPNRYGEQEFQALLSARVKRLLNTRAIELITYRDLDKN